MTEIALLAACLASLALAFMLFRRWTCDMPKHGDGHSCRQKR